MEKILPKKKNLGEKSYRRKEDKCKTADSSKRGAGTMVFPEY